MYTYPVNYISNKTIFAPQEFGGEWNHSVLKNIKNLIIKEGWNPSKNQMSIYGTAVYLARTNWHKESTNYCLIKCQLSIKSNEVMCFTTEKTLINYLRDQGLNVGINPAKGTSEKNKTIQSFFKSKGVKAIKFEERGFEIAVIYDPSCIYIFKEGIICE